MEDDVETLDVLQTWFEHRGCSVQIARSGEAALAMSGSFKPSVVVTDYLLEDHLTGVDVIVGLRNKGVRAKCVLVTAVLPRALRESLHRIHGVIILAKPVSFSRLSEIIATR